MKLSKTKLGKKLIRKAISEVDAWKGCKVLADLAYSQGRKDESVRAIKEIQERRDFWIQEGRKDAFAKLKGQEQKGGRNKNECCLC
jgi:hypothetical protein